MKTIEAILFKVVDVEEGLCLWVRNKTQAIFNIRIRITTTKAHCSLLHAIGMTWDWHKVESSPTISRALGAQKPIIEGDFTHLQPVGHGGCKPPQRAQQSASTFFVENINTTNDDIIVSLNIHMYIQIDACMHWKL